MIRYALTCANGHSFESWFASTAACESLLAAGRVSCIDCGSAEVSKALMAPSVLHGKASEPPAAAASPPAPTTGPLSTPRSDVERALAALRREIEQNSEYVGMDFASEARAIHAGEAPKRSIFGEARLDEARSLLEDGVPVAPLPFLPSRKAN